MTVHPKVVADCRKKVRYVSRKRAASAAMRIRDSRYLFEALGRVEYIPYECPACGRFHLTKKTKEPKAS